ncbi:MAG: 2-isopropylmalate synthase [Oscillatoria sp. PMC 1051.18]|nr:2-isopropylmalate synthase [Oscillatoria sp. PMC 1050.18]MEC5031578.1 2-isopropylmalate synthase [Oscillatoria sp. PMC 1051.18]
MLVNNQKVIILDTTMRDGELAPGIQMNLQQKLQLAELLEAMKIDVIEVGYPGYQSKDFHEIVEASKIIKNSTICGLASSKTSEINLVAEALKFAKKPRIHTYNSVNLPKLTSQKQAEVFNNIKATVTLARNYCDDIQWSAFDATRSEANFLCQAVEIAIESGATTINIPDSMGQASTAEFGQLLQTIFNRVPNIQKVITSVHCHSDRNLAVANSLIALELGARQIECAINGLGARKGNTDLAQFVKAINQKNNPQIALDTTLISQASVLVSKITKTEKLSM